MLPHAAAPASHPKPYPTVWAFTLADLGPHLAVSRRGEGYWRKSLTSARFRQYLVSFGPAGLKGAFCRTTRQYRDGAKNAQSKILPTWQNSFLGRYHTAYVHCTSSALAVKNPGAVYQKEGLASVSPAWDNLHHAIQRQDQRGS